jgi:hypothetical protein
MPAKMKWPVIPNIGVRGSDGFGSGAFNAPRVAGSHSAGKNPGDHYGHKGLDIATRAEHSTIVSPFAGKISHPGFAYKGGVGGLRSIHIIGSGEWKGYRATILYARLYLGFVDGTDVREGEHIARAQDIAGFKMVGTTRKMINHIHLELRRANPIGLNGMTVELLDPTEYLETA